MNEYLISQLKEGRINKGLKQSDVATKIGVKGNTLSNYENGVSEPDIDTFCALCDIYGLDAAELLGEAYGLGVQGSDFAIKPSEIEHIKKYRELDSHGKDIVDYILLKEWERVDALKSSPAAAEHDNTFRLVNYYYRLASAGTGQILFDTPPTKRIEIPNIQKYAHVDYAIGVNGNSMEPMYHDGDTLLVEMTDEISVGSIGIFCVDDNCYVKKLGNAELISLNADYPNIPLNETARCMGRVIDKLAR